MTLESKTPIKKTIKVVAAYIKKDDKFFGAQRDYGFLKGKWEFPGGKIEANETPEEALKREIYEELDTKIEVGDFLFNVTYPYPEFILDMNVYEASVLSGRLEIEKGIHSAEAFFKLSDVNINDWCPADQIVLSKLKQRTID
jgi:8-oxo-dGTP diphosphatase